MLRGALAGRRLGVRYALGGVPYDIILDLADSLIELLDDQDVGSINDPARRTALLCLPMQPPMQRTVRRCGCRPRSVAGRRRCASRGVRVRVAAHAARRGPAALIQAALRSYDVDPLPVPGNLRFQNVASCLGVLARIPSINFRFQGLTCGFFECRKGPRREWRRTR